MDEYREDPAFALEIGLTWVMKQWDLPLVLSPEGHDKWIPQGGLVVEWLAHPVSAVRAFDRSKAA
ncbi:hypothetical protein [Streptomyces beihaiensis]|uniref:Uncharacterized protein n=1 Tax=Streptomyces beihaiensis TaxID=2984495 RepID=A0ABT3U4S6_9ACTN|nr:hypothetical protein [Streptomyces beihaiensis]MCX3063567.1 hypothetical protein [Streptomyces beihaiensis]